MTTTAPTSSGAAGPAPSASDLTVDEQAALTAGADMWHSAGVERLGVAGIGLTDGPSGARGSQFTGTTSTSLPVRHGAGLDVEPRADRAGRSPARRRGPVQGRQRAAGADGQHPPPPARRAELRVLLRGPVPDGRDRGGVHRGRAEPGRGLRGQALRAATTRRPTAWRSTSSSTSAPGARSTSRRSRPPCAAPACGRSWPPTTASTASYCSEHPGLLTDLLRDEWGFDGVVVSDWFGTHSTAALAAGLDLEMPGPAQRARPPPGRRARGRRRHRRGGRAGRAAGARPDRADRAVAAQPLGDRRREPADAAGIARAAATEAIVLLANDGVLPLDATAGAAIAVIGWRADQPEFQGGGSAQVTPAVRDHAAAGHHRPCRRRHGDLRGRPADAPVGADHRPPAARPTATASRRSPLDYFAARRPVGGTAPHARPCARRRPSGSANRPPGSRRATSRPA